MSLLIRETSPETIFDPIIPLLKLIRASSRKSVVGCFDPAQPGNWSRLCPLIMPFKHEGFCEWPRLDDVREGILAEPFDVCLQAGFHTSLNCF